MAGDVEVGTCNVCKKEHTEVSRRYYYYVIGCECCDSSEGHFEIVWYCKDCDPKPPYRISAVVKHVRMEI